MGVGHDPSARVGVRKRAPYGIMGETMQPARWTVLSAASVGRGSPLPRLVGLARGFLVFDGGAPRDWGTPTWESGWCAASVGRGSPLPRP